MLLTTAMRLYLVAPARMRACSKSDARGRCPYRSGWGDLPPVSQWAADMMRRRLSRLGNILARDTRHVRTKQTFQPSNPAAAIATVGEERALFCARECHKERVHLLYFIRG